MYGRLTKDITSWGSCVKLRERVHVLCDHPIFCDIFLMDGFSPQMLFWPFPFLHDLPFLTRDSSNSTLNNEDETTTSRITLRSTPRTNHRKQTNNQKQEKKTKNKSTNLHQATYSPYHLFSPPLSPVTANNTHHTLPSTEQPWFCLPHSRKNSSGAQYAPSTQATSQLSGSTGKQGVSRRSSPCGGLGAGIGE